MFIQLRAGFAAEQTGTDRLLVVPYEILSVRNALDDFRTAYCVSAVAVIPACIMHMQIKYSRVEVVVFLPYEVLLNRRYVKTT